MMRVLRGHGGQVVFSVLMSIIGVACGVVPYFAAAKMINLIFEGCVDLSVFLPLVGWIFAGLFGGILFHDISTLVSHNLAFSIIATERKRLANKLERVSMGEIEKRSSGQWAQFMVETLDKMETPIAHVIPEVLGNVIVSIVLIIIVFVLNWKIGLANLGTLPIAFIFSMMMMSGYAEKFQNWQDAAKEMNTTAVEYIKGIKVIKAFNKSASSYEKFRGAVNKNRDSMLNWFLSVAFATSAVMEILPATLLVVLPIALLVYMHGGIDIGTLIVCVLLSHASYKPLLKMSMHTENMATLKPIFDEIDSVLEMPELERGNETKSVNSYQVDFKNVGFGYDENIKVFEGLSFTAEANQLTALVGYSGSGKSTIAKLIAGFWNANSGEITIGGVDLKSMPLKQNMQLVSYVSQDNYLFKKTIAENMRMAKQDATMDEIKEACKKANCDEFIQNLPKGYDTVVGEAGASLSGGERQRITIARALLKNSPIIVLDEATAYSDPDNEAIIQKSIDALVANKTVIMIAHRLSTIVNADKIIVLNDGKIEAEGKHSELLEKSKTYSKMWHSHMSVCEQENIMEEK